MTLLHNLPRLDGQVTFNMIMKNDGLAQQTRLAVMYIQTVQSFNI